MAKKRGEFKLEVPLDAAEIEDFKPEKPVKVVVRDAAGELSSQTVKLSSAGKGTASFDFKGRPGELQVFVGPGDATDEEVLNLQNVRRSVAEVEWKNRTTLKVDALRITAYYWRWWLVWCRTFTVRGRVLCANGNPVPSATVCAYDVDFWWWWLSKQLVGCALTGPDGTFELKFRWCCGWWPWWWWYLRTWRVEPELADLILPVLQRELDLQEPPIPQPQPDLSLFAGLLEDEGPVESVGEFAEQVSLAATRSVGGASRAAAVFEPNALDALQARLVKRLPRIERLEALRLWPWWPWHPWFDCRPDLIFRVTQDCGQPGTVIVDESFWNARWNVPTLLENVDLVANDKACCVVQPDPDPPGSCIVLSSVCRRAHDRIGGNERPVTTPASQIGYLDPYKGGLPRTTNDRPFGEAVTINGVFGTTAAVAYYEFEWRHHAGGPWQAMPSGAIRGFYRRFYGRPLGAPPGTPSDFFWIHFPVQEISDGTVDRRVIESRQHFEATHEPGTWGPGNIHLWLDINYFRLIYWQTKNYFGDGTYDLRLVGWDKPGSQLTNRRVLPLCFTEEDNNLVITLDNRYIGSPGSHVHSCGPGTVHSCTVEPDTAILAVNIGGEAVGACGTNENKTGPVVIDFLASDPQGHLAYYTLFSKWGDGWARNLLRLVDDGKAVLAQLPGPATQIGPTYARAIGQGATPPIWRGGRYRLTIPDILDAFPETCCYQLQLRAHKRTMENCSSSLWAQTNYSEYSFGVVV